MELNEEIQSIEVKNAIQSPLEKFPIYAIKTCGFIFALLFCASESNEDRYAVKSAFTFIPVVGEQIGEIAGWITFLGKALGMNKLTRNEINEFVERLEQHYEFYLFAKKQSCDGTTLSPWAFAKAYYHQRQSYQEFLKQGRKTGLKEQNLAHYINNRLVEDFENQQSIFYEKMLIKIQKNQEILTGLQKQNINIEILCLAIKNHINSPIERSLISDLGHLSANKASIEALLAPITQDIKKFKEKLKIKQRIYQDIESDFVLELTQTAEKERQAYYKNQGKFQSFLFWFKQIFYKDKELENLKKSLRERLKKPNTFIDWPGEYESEFKKNLSKKIEAFQEKQAKYQEKQAKSSSIFAEYLAPEIPIEDKISNPMSINHFLARNDVESIRFEYRLQWNRYYKKSLQLEKQFQKNDRHFLAKHKQEVAAGETEESLAQVLNAARKAISIQLDEFYFSNLKETINNPPIKGATFKIFNPEELSNYFADNDPILKEYFDSEVKALFKKKEEKATNFFEKIVRDFHKDEEEIYQFFRKKHAQLKRENNESFYELLTLNIAWDKLSEDQKNIVRENQEYEKLKKARQQARLEALEVEEEIYKKESLVSFTSIQAENTYLQALRKNREAYLQRIKKLIKPIRFRNIATGLGQILGVLAALADAATAFLNGKTLLMALILLLSSMGVSIVLNGALWPILLVGGLFALSVFVSAFFLMRPAAVEVTENAFDKLRHGFKKITPIKIIHGSITGIFATISAAGAGLFVYQFFSLELIPFISQFIIVANPLALSLGIAIPIALLAFYEVLSFRGIKLYHAVDHIIKFFQGRKSIGLEGLSTKQKCFIPVIAVLAFFAAFASASAAFFGASAFMPTPVAVLFAIASFVCVLAVIIPPLKDIFIGKPEKEIAHVEHFDEDSIIAQLNNTEEKKLGEEEKEIQNIIPKSQLPSINFLSFPKKPEPFIKGARTFQGEFKSNLIGTVG